MGQSFFKFSTKRETVTANAVRSHPECEEKKDLGKNTKLLDDRLALETRFSNGGLTQLSMTRPRSPTETMMVV